MHMLGQRIGAAAALLILFLSCLTPTLAAEPQPAHGASMYGDLKYGPDFTHFAYVNPNAPKGGTLVQSAVNTYDNLNPYILRGVAAAGLGLIFETLATGSLDEPFSEYGLIAQGIVVPEDRSWVAFELNPNARWHDGKPITVEDVIWSFETLKTQGHPFYRAYFANVVKAEKEGERRVRFTFERAGNRELPLIMGQLPILPKHYYATRPFDQPTLEPPLGSGPYRIKAVQPGRSIAYERVADYWGKDLPVNRGRYNYDEIRFEYFRDRDIAFEAFKAGQFDLFLENSAKRWATGYTGPAFDSGRIKREELPDESDNLMQGFAFNIRRDKFKDPRVRLALNYAFDFEWTNKNLFYGAYTRIRSYFSGSELASRGLPEGKELALLEPYRDKLPPEVFTAEYRPPVTDGSGNNRDNLRKAFELLKAAGWEIKDGRLTNSATGERMTIEFLEDDPSFERVMGPFIKSLERLGIQAGIRTVDVAQYQNRLDNFDFDVITTVWGQSQSPGNEQRDFWGSTAADTPGSRNYIGIKDPVVDALVDAVIHADSRADLIAACRALDRVLLWGHYVIPHWQIKAHRIAYWDKLSRPEVVPPYGLDLFAWWIDPAKAARLGGAKPAPGG